MPKVYKHSNISLSPMIQPTRDTEKALVRVEKMEERVAEGYKLVALEAASTVYNFIKNNAPMIDDDDYSDRLEVVFSVANSGEVSVSIVGKNKERKTSVNDSTEIAFLYAKGMMEPATSKAYEVLRKYQPWPVSMYPLPTGLKSKIGLATRRVSRFEYDKQMKRINRSKGLIEQGLKGAGFEVSIESSSDPRSVQTDLAFAILQVEYGIGRKPNSHWRPAVNLLKRELNVLQDKFRRYVIDGRKSIFAIDNNIVEVSKIKELDEQLQEKIAQSTGFKLDDIKEIKDE